MKDQEKHIDGSFKAKMVEKGIYKDPETTYKEKQIEEMARIIAFDLCPFGKLHAKLYNNKANCASNDNFAECTKINKVVENLYEQGYRKLPKDSVVLSKEEYDCLKRIEKAYDPFWFCSFGGCEGACKECKDTCEMSIFVKERKETAEKIIHDLDMKISNYAMVLDLPELPEKIRLIPTEVMVHFVKTLKEQFGVEIKEN